MSNRKTCKKMDRPVPGNLCMRLNRHSYLLHDDDYDNDNDNGGEDGQNKLPLLVGICLFAATNITLY